ncbi:MAG: response regulator [Leptolyngbyaceae cyanobacterium SM1_3_5]|nr:response regulator [Leptolyngbyaceae cyanobacterium SM1_3_5]
MMSHEIRTPMNGVIGTAELLLNSGLTSHQRQLVEIINSSGQALLSVINDILDFSKIEAGAIELESQPFDLRSCIRGAVNLLAAQATAKKIELAFLDRANLPNSIVGDPTRLRQILINLIGNAIKFTELGEVIISATAHLHAEDRYEIKFAIQDTGIGIPSDRLSSLFQEFSQVDTSITRRYGGTGLGLAISKRLCEQMGGKMWVESQLDRGSTFYFTITATAVLEAIDRPTIQSIQPLRSHSLKILLAEDHPINQRLMLLMLNQLGYQADIANNGVEVLAALHREAYDLILMDVQMPELDGIATTEQINQGWQAIDRPRIIALTAGAMKEDRQRCLQAGMSDYLTKPVRLDELAQVLSQSRSRSTNQAVEFSQIKQSKSERLIDPEVLRQLQFATRHSATFIAEIIDLYFQKAPDLIATIRNSLDQGDCRTFKRAVHTLQGCSASIGAIQLTEQCRAIEEAVDNQGLGKLFDRVIEIETAYKNLQNALQQERKNYVGT